MLKKVLTFILSVIKWDSLLEIVLELGKKLMTEWLYGKDWSEKAKSLTIIFYTVAKLLGVTWSKETPTVNDDVLVETIIGMCEDLAERKEFTLPLLK